MAEISATMTVQAAIPRRAFGMLETKGIRERLRAMNSPRTTFEDNEHHAGIGKVRLTTIVFVMTVIADELRIAAGEAEQRGDHDTLLACAQGVAAIFRAIDGEKNRLSGPAAQTTRPEPN